MQSGSHPGLAIYRLTAYDAGSRHVAKLVYAPDLGSGGYFLASSILAMATMKTASFSDFLAGKVKNPIAISRTVPPEYSRANLPRYMKLAPPSELFNEFKYGAMKGNVPYFNDEFYRYLSELDAHAVFNELKERVSWQEPTLLCWEPKGQFCHRHIVAEWFRFRGISCSEIDDAEEYPDDLF